MSYPSSRRPTKYGQLPISHRLPLDSGWIASSSRRTPQVGGHLCPVRSAYLGPGQTGHCSTRPESPPENRAIADPAQDTDSHCCGLCGHPQGGLAHIICDCPRTTHARAGARSDLWYFASTQASAPVARLMQRYTQLIFEHPTLDQRGQLWLGHWTPTLRQDLSPLLLGLPLREGQAALARIGRRATAAFHDLWAAYGEALAIAQPPTSDPDLFSDPPPTWSAPLTPLSPSSPPLRQHSPGTLG